jgi:hypothetical protein
MPTYRLPFTKTATSRRRYNLTKEVPAAGAAGFAGNVIAGGLIGMGVDAATGAATDHKPTPVIVTLQPKGVTARKPKVAAPAEHWNLSNSRQGTTAAAS